MIGACLILAVRTAKWPPLDTFSASSNPTRSPAAVIVGHDWGTAHAWNAALMRSDRFKAVLCISVPYVPRRDAANPQKTRTIEASFNSFLEIIPVFFNREGGCLHGLLAKVRLVIALH